VKIFLRQLEKALTPGVRLPLGLLVVAYVMALLGHFTHTFSLPVLLALTHQQFFAGQIWRLVTYALLPNGWMDLIANVFVLIFLGGILERTQSRHLLWMLCLVSAITAGAVRVAVPFPGDPPLLGAGPMALGLLAAWCFLSGQEIVMVPLLGEMRVWQVFLVATALSLVITIISAGVSMALLMAGGGLGGWLYVWLRWKWFMNRAARTVHSERIRRLEL
jgi:membrane associated rhomboid family serine protease